MRINRRQFLKTSNLVVASSALAGASVRAAAGPTVVSLGPERLQPAKKPKIIDFRVRPPYKSFATNFLFRPRPKVDPATGTGLARGRPRYRSYEEKSIEVFVEEMDEAGIDIAVVMGRQASAQYGSIPNEELAELMQRYPGRFIVFGGIDGSKGAATLKEIDRCRTMGFKGIALDNGWLDPPLYDDDEKLFPVYEKCEREQLILSLTSSIAVGPDMTYSMPVHVQRVARRFPKVNIVVPHNGWPWVTEMCGVAFSNANIYLLADYYVFIPDVPGADQVVRFGNVMLGDRLLYASGYPVRPLKQSIDEFRKLPFASDAIRNRCLVENAARLLGLSS